MVLPQLRGPLREGAAQAYPARSGGIRVPRDGVGRSRSLWSPPARSGPAPRPGRWRSPVRPRKGPALCCACGNCSGRRSRRRAYLFVCRRSSCVWPGWPLGPAGLASPGFSTLRPCAVLRPDAGRCIGPGIWCSVLSLCGGNCLAAFGGDGVSHGELLGTWWRLRCCSV